MKIYDVVIIGGGPGGTSAAYRLAQEGLHVCLVERAKMPRNKICSGGITLKAWNDLPLDDEDRNKLYNSININPVSQLCLTSFTNDPIICAYDKPIIFMVERKDFDLFLLQRAVHKGIDVYYETVEDVSEGQDSILIKTPERIYCAKYAIAAWGAKSGLKIKNTFSKKLNLEGAVEFTVSMNKDMEQNSICVDWDSLDFGYGWAWPKKFTMSLGAVAVGIGKNVLLTYIQSYASKLQITLPSDHKSHPIPISGKQPLVQNNRLLYVGDAAGLADPMTRSGIGTAISSGVMAAEFIINNKYKGINSDYQLIINNVVVPELNASLLLRQWAESNKGALHLMVRDREDFRLALCSILTGELSYTKLIKNIF